MKRHPLIEIQEKIDRIIFDAARDGLSVRMENGICTIESHVRTPLGDGSFTYERQKLDFTFPKLRRVEN